MGPHAQLVARTRLSGEACQVNRLALEQNAIKEQVWGGVRPARGNDKGVLAVKVQSTGVRPMPRRRGWRWWGALVSAVAVAIVGLASPASANDRIDHDNNDRYAEWVNVNSGLCLTVTGLQGTAVVQQACAVPASQAPQAQQWEVFCEQGTKILGNENCVTGSRNLVHGQPELLVNRRTGLCLDALGGASNGTPMVSWRCNEITNQFWNDFDPYSTDVFGGGASRVYSLMSRVSGTRGFCLDVPGASKAEGVQLRLWKCNGTNAQIFALFNHP